MSGLPAPMTPARSDLRDFTYMPLEIVRWRGSDQVALASPEENLAALMLYTAAWHETPSASLTDDDRLLAKAAGYGRAVDAFLAVKIGAMRGFVKCADGRLYHPTVARLANDAWRSKIEQRYRTELARVRKYNERHPDQPVEAPSLEDFAATFPDGIPSVHVTAPACHADTTGMSDGQGEAVTRTHAECSRDRGSKRSKGKGSKGNLDSGANAPSSANADLDAAFVAWNEAAERCGWPKATKLEGTRRKKLAARLRSEGFDGWSAALARAEASGYLTSGEATWFALDWFSEPAKFQKVAEGNYDDRTGSNGNSAWGAARERNRDDLRGLRPDPALDLYRLGVAGEADERREELARKSLTRQSNMITARAGFSGEVIDADPVLIAEWSSAFHAIEDLHAELVGIDAWLTGAGKDVAANWRAKVPGMLSRTHQKILAARRDDDGAACIVPGLC